MTTDHATREKGRFFQADVARYGLKEAHRRWDRTAIHVIEHQQQQAGRWASRELSASEPPRAAAPLDSTQVERLVRKILQRTLPGLVEPLVDARTDALVSQRIADELPAAAAIALENELLWRHE